MAQAHLGKPSRLSPHSRMVALFQPFCKAVYTEWTPKTVWIRSQANTIAKAPTKEESATKRPFSRTEEPVLLWNNHGRLQKSRVIFQAPGCSYSKRASASE